MMSRTPLDRRILMVAVPAAPTPVTTTRSFLRSFFTMRSALSSAASTTTAVPCWSSWKTGDVQFLAQPLLDLEAARGRDVFEVDAAEARCQVLHRLDDLVRLLRGQADREGVDVGELLEEHRLAFHDRQRRLGADVAQPEHG